MVLNSLLGKRTIQHTLVHQLSGKNEVFHGLLSPIIILTRVGINYLDQNGRAGFLRWWQNSTQLQGKSINVKKKQTRLNFMLNCNKINGFFILHRSGRKKLCSANMTSKLVSKIKGGQSKKGKYVFLNGLFYQMVCHVNVCEAMSSRNGIPIRPPRPDHNM